MVATVRPACLVLPASPAGQPPPARAVVRWPEHPAAVLAGRIAAIAWASADGVRVGTACSSLRAMSSTGHETGQQGGQVQQPPPGFFSCITVLFGRVAHHRQRSAQDEVDRQAYSCPSSCRVRRCVTLHRLIPMLFRITSREQDSGLDSSLPSSSLSSWSLSFRLGAPNKALQFKSLHSERDARRFPFQPPSWFLLGTGAGLEPATSTPCSG